MRDRDAADHRLLIFLTESSYPSFVALLQIHTSFFIFHHRELVSLASGTAVSGFGLWLVSRWAAKNEAGPRDS